jgi:hypothetical protein
MGWSSVQGSRVQVKPELAVSSEKWEQLSSQTSLVPSCSVFEGDSGLRKTQTFN